MAKVLTTKRSIWKKITRLSFSPNHNTQYSFRQLINNWNSEEFHGILDNWPETSQENQKEETKKEERKKEPERRKEAEPLNLSRKRCRVSYMSFNSFMYDICVKSLYMYRT
ncbi:uncharacterized protein LOC121380499 [Gigantopelta aegis]|uniref:uncharacterized protein LOC121380499 n=1 Tax=Gigantopelta aegis TaxID=1735272 RepID=UPI001B88B367|nr:uncharacterized protein LOC121380499 [Gigantopelta aegis]